MSNYKPFFYRVQMDILRDGNQAKREVIELCWLKLLILDNGDIVETNQTGIERIKIADYEQAQFLIDQLTPVLIEIAEAQIEARELEEKARLESEGDDPL